ncbi:hypothetical protein HMPREF9967_0223 [Streptococcus infantis SK1076]|jgi:hypothetical protein|uniref:Uncharacterized protein n=1 Tax=Streptococcus infantis SK1076 TaxID=1005705 RepID=F5W2L8_9STRE|nr:hypothetical protein [Streptococcus infantis]EGL84332.1 hypothetical protein HMPREF9967_0223 [Streptococcus infantis SK1076]
MMLSLIKNNLYLFIIIGIALVILTVLVCFLVEKIIINYFTKIDYRKKYDHNKLLKKITLREDSKRNYFYYGIDYWIWQENKLKLLKTLLPIGTELPNGKIISDILPFTKVTTKIFGSGNRETRYRRELRFIPDNIPRNISSYGDNVYGDKIGGDKFENHQGVQNIHITKFQVIQPLEKLLMEEELSEIDRAKIKNFVSNLAMDNSSEDDKLSIIEILNNYIGVIGGVAGIIDVLHNFKIL